MKKGGTGGANTTTGLKFEFRTDLAEFLSQKPGYRIEKSDKDTKTGKLRSKAFRWTVYYENHPIAEIFQKDGLYRYFDGINYDYRKVLSKKLLPDDSIFIYETNTIYIIEKKYQEVAGSVDEKPQTGPFKLKQYQRLFSPLRINVAYIYLFNSDWWGKAEYKDMLDYIRDVGCNYYFDSIPLEDLGLPEPC